MFLLVLCSAEELREVKKTKKTKQKRVLVFEGKTGLTGPLLIQLQQCFLEKSLK